MTTIPIITLRDNRSDKNGIRNGLRFKRETKNSGRGFFVAVESEEGVNDNEKLELKSTLSSVLAKFGKMTLADLTKDSVLFLSPDSHLKSGEREKLSFFTYDPITAKNPDDLMEFRLDTGNLMGVLRFRDNNKPRENVVQVEVLSRFDKGQNNFFLNYILSKAFDVSFGFNEVSADDNSFLDSLLDIIFVRQLAEAAKVGLFRQYRERRCNDWNFKGSLDLPRHLRENVPLMHGIAYRKREIEHDVPLNQMILLAAKVIRKRRQAPFDSNEDARDAFRQLQMIVPEPVSIRDVLRERTCREPVSHPYFQEVYEPLRQTAKMILEEERWSLFADGESEVSGVVFDCSWLWENYLWALLQESGIEGLVHGENAKQENPIYPFGDSAVLEWYPDFYIKNKAVLDAKYKNLDSGKVQSGDAHEVISYMHVLDAESGFLLHPSGNDDSQSAYPIKGKGGKFHIVGLKIPRYDDVGESPAKDEAYARFCADMEKSEKDFIDKLKSFLKPHDS